MIKTYVVIENNIVVNTILLDRDIYPNTQLGEIVELPSLEEINDLITGSHVNVILPSKGDTYIDGVFTLREDKTFPQTYHDENREIPITSKFWKSPGNLETIEPS